MNTVKEAPRAVALAGVLLLAGLPGLSTPGHAAETDSLSPALSTTQIQDVRYEESEAGTRIIIDASAPLVYTSYSPEPGVLVVDMAGTSSRDVAGTLPVGTLEVRHAAVMGQGTDTEPSASITIQMADADATYQFESLGNRLVVSFDRLPSEVEAADAPVAEMAPIAPEAEMAPRADATVLRSVAAREEGGAVLVTLAGDGAFQSWNHFVIDDPSRIIVDLEGITNESLEESISVDANGLARIRVAQYQAEPVPVTRVVLDLNGAAEYDIRPDAAGDLALSLGGTVDTMAAVEPVEAAPEAELVELAPPVDPAPAEALDVEVEEIPFESAFDLGEDVTLFETANATLQEEPIAQRGQIPISFETKTIGGGETPYNGKPLSLDFKDADIKDIFRFISDFSGLNVVLDPTVSGKITIKLTEVPWDQALDIILKNNGLGMVYENNVIRIATTQKLATEEANRRRLQEEKELAVPLKTITRALSYAKAQDLSGIIGKVMSKRGEVITDDRTNTLVLTDIPDRFDIITNLIETLDAPTPQVSIETRIVETTRDFAQNLGIQWGFLGVSDAAHGNTTNLIFPNNAVVSGNAISPQQGIGSTIGGYAVNLPAAETNSGIGFSFGNVLNTFQLDIALTAFEREGKGRVISAPKVTTQNNEEATIKSGKQIPVTTIANNTVTTIFVDALLELKVEPQITAEGTVIMEIKVNKSQPDFANLVLGTPPIDKREAETSVLVRDGGTTVIGGIFQVTDQNSQQRTPFLSRIPIIGNLFKNKGVNRLNNELLIFVTPRIVKY